MSRKSTLDFLMNQAWQPLIRDALLGSPLLFFQQQVAWLFLQVIRADLMSCLDIAKSGLLAVVLRGLACGNAVVRRCSYEALALYSEAVETSNFRSAGLHCLYALCGPIDLDSGRGI